ncbi:MAG: hypothetical protein JWN32_3132 [Solirubrobacterales bacterium]|nr:hypothetical protein [Solirubrobacterales bacterium]
MNNLLTDKNIIVYGAGGGIGRGVAATFAREGARVFLAGRTRASLEKVAAAIGAAGGSAEVAELDVFDEPAVDEHARDVASRAGSLDVSFNLVSRGDVQGIPLADMTTADFMAPITAGVAANFVTARAAARHMVEQGSGVIMTLTSGSSKASPMLGGTGPADAAVEAFLRNLAAEVGSFGVRVAGLWTAGVPETFDLGDEDTNVSRKRTGMTGEDIDRVLGPMTMLKRAPRLAQVADSAAFLASDRAAGITGTILNVTCGLVTN